MNTTPISPPRRSGGPTRHHLVDRMAAVVSSGDFAGMLRASAELADAVRTSPIGAELVEDLRSFAAEGTLASLVALEALAVVPYPSADAVIVELLTSRELVVQRHAAWRLGSRLPVRRAYVPLLELVARGGLDTLHAHRTLRSWAASDARLIAELSVVQLTGVRNGAGRARIIDLIGALDEPATTGVLLGVADDTTESAAARIAAVGAVGERPGGDVDVLLERLATGDDELAAHAALALAERRGARASADDRGAGLRIAQLVLAEGLDGQLSLGGRGDVGGVASLLVSLAEVLADRPDVERVLTIGRGSATDALVAPTPPLESALVPTAAYGVIALGSSARRAESPADVWEQLPAIERGLRRALRQAGPIDLLHLRMADAGTLAGAEAARQLGIDVCFSVAPDPHNVVQSLQSRGELDAARFVELDLHSGVWFRARLVEQLTRSAERLALFPRTEPLDFMEAANSLRPDQRAAVVAEGIDLDLIRRVSDELAGLGDARGVLRDLAELIPPARRHLPLVLSVGRLNPVKGMDRVVAAWAADPNLYTASNLVLVGGDLHAPSASERAVLDEIERTVPHDDVRRDGLVLLGGRSRRDVALIQVATAAGVPGCWAGGGVYVDGALKEEFGLAVLEAMAAGLVVVAPSTGGPATYVVDGETGVLVDPGADLADAIRRSFELVGRRGRVDAAKRTVAERYSIQAMAAQLVELYRPAEVMA